MIEEFIVDDLRIINSTNTQLRRLEIISGFIRKIGRRQIPSELLKVLMIEWSIKLEKLFPEYAKKNGRLTINQKPTSAFQKYVFLIKEMGLIKQLGSVISLTTNGILLFTLINDNDELSIKLSKQEKLFYINLLITKDFDYTILVLNLLIKNSNLSNQTDLQKEFKSELIKRLNLKIDSANKQAQSKIHEKLMIVSNEWKNAESYSEHIIAPRLEWLLDLNIVDKKKNAFLITKSGFDFFNSFKKINKDEFQKITDTNKVFLYERKFSVFKKIIPNNDDYSMWSDIEIIKKEELLGESLNMFSKTLKSGSALRVVLEPSLLFTCIYIFVNYKIVIEFNEIIQKLKQSFLYGNKIYSVKTSARINEGYINIKLNF